MLDLELYLINREFLQPRIDDIEGEIVRKIKEYGICNQLKPGYKVAITAGSRGIANLPIILKTLVSIFCQCETHPFIVPAMGSHGGATAEGQLEVLESLGITEDTIGVPILSSMEVTELGKTANGCPVFMDQIAFHSDAIFIVNRVKVHTRFKADHESGLLKMIAVGLGKRKGCSIMHQYGLYPAIVDASRLALSRAPIIGGLGIVENAYQEIAKLEVTKKKGIERLDAELLKLEKTLFPCLPIEDIDLLIVDEMGKNISGTGMDTNVIGRVSKPCMNEDEKPHIKKIVALNLHDASHGNALGMGLADIITRQFYENIDFKVTYENVIAANILERAKMPVIMKSDRDAISLAINLITTPSCKEPKVIYIKNTSELSRIIVSGKVLDEMNDKGLKNLNPERASLRFDTNGNLIKQDWHNSTVR